MNQEFLAILKDVLVTRPDVKISHGGSGGACEKAKERPAPMKMLKNYIDNNQMRLYDFFCMMDKDKSMSLSIEEFVKGLEVSVRLCVFYTEDDIEPRTNKNLLKNRLSAAKLEHAHSSTVN